MTLALRQRPLARVVAGIVRANDGALFDPSDLSTLYQDAAGTIPVTAVEQPVGLMLDKSRGMMLGPELVSNGDFSDGLTGWSITGNDATHTVTPVTGGVRFLSDTTNPILFLRQTNPLLASAYVEITIDIDYTSGQLKFDALSTSVPILQGRNKYRVFLNGIGVFTVYRIVANVNALIRSVSVKIISGYHATQSITASRPTLSARYNLLTKTEDFSDAAWTKQAAGTATAPVVTNNYGLAPDGTVTAARLQMALNGGTTTTDRSCLLQGPPMVSGTTYTSTFWVKSNTAQSYVVQQRLGFSAQNITIDQTWRAYTYSQTVSSDNTHWLALRGAQGTSDAADILIWHPQLIIGATPGPYQRVNTTTDYDTDERYFKKYLRFDGVDDYLNLPYMGLYAGGSASVVAGLTMTNANPQQRLIHETNTGNSAPWYGLFRKVWGECGIGILDDSGSALVSNTASFGDVSKVKVIAEIDSGARADTYINSLTMDSDSYTRAGKTVTLNNTTIGASVSTTTTGYINASVYSLIITKSVLSDAQRIKCERYAASKAGVIL